jgi:hypothetical protein
MPTGDQAAPLTGMTEDVALENYRNAWTALRMIREVVETLGPPGVLPPRKRCSRSTGPSRSTKAKLLSTRSLKC